MTEQENFTLHEIDLGPLIEALGNHARWREDAIAHPESYPPDEVADMLDAMRTALLAAAEVHLENAHTLQRMALLLAGDSANFAEEAGGFEPFEDRPGDPG